jgi:NNP family nitrate/nitrite transporter-like MFS transporter
MYWQIKLVPQYFPHAVGSDRLVGAAGGLGGFFPPLVLSLIRQETGAFTWGFILLAIFSLSCLAVCWKTASRAGAIATDGESVWSDQCVQTRIWQFLSSYYETKPGRTTPSLNLLNIQKSFISCLHFQFL